MGWEDRPYYRDNPGGLSANPIIRALNGSVPLFTAFGIRVRMHASLIVLIVAVILLDFRSNNPYHIQDRALSMGCLAIIIIMHEFGHCFAARSVGGEARDILLWPLGGLAFCEPPHRPWPTFWTVAGGPLVNVGICIVCAVAVYFLSPGSHMPGYPHVLMSLNPFNAFPIYRLSFSDPTYYFWWLYGMSYIILLFNLLPIFPLDGGQMFQAILWPHYGYFKSMNIATIVGMVGGCLLVGFGVVHGLDFNLIFIGIMGFWYCRQKRTILLEMGHEPWSDDTGGVDYNASIYGHDEPKRKRKHLNRRAIAQARKIAQTESDERARIDTILAKVSAQGMASLTWSERRTLRKATERQRKSEMEMSKYK